MLPSLDDSQDIGAAGFRTGRPEGGGDSVGGRRYLAVALLTVSSMALSSIGSAVYLAP